MKKEVVITSIICLAFIASVGFAQQQPSPAAPEAKPITRVMLSRLGWIQSIAKNLAYSNFDGVAKDSAELTAQTKKVGEASTAEFNKERNLMISSLATAMADAAGRKDAAGTVQKFSEVLGTCYSCHAKLRDNKK